MFIKHYVDKRYKIINDYLGLYMAENDAKIELKISDNKMKVTKEVYFYGVFFWRLYATASSLNSDPV